MDPTPLTGIAWFVAQNVLLLNLSHVITGGMEIRRLSLRWAARFVTAILLVILVSTLLVFLRLYRIEVVVLVFLLLNGVFAFRVGPRESARTFLSDAGAALRALGRILRRDRWLTVALGTVLGFLLVRAVLTPPLSWDAQTYHLFHAGTLVAQGGIQPLDAPDAWSYYRYFCLNGELVYAWVMLPFHGDFLVNAVNLLFWVPMVLFLRELLRGLFRNDRTAFPAAVLLATFPAVFSYLTTAYVEPLLFCFVFAALVLVPEDPADRRGPLFVLAWAAAGCAVGTKLFGVLVVPPALVATGVFLWRRNLRLRHGVAALLLFAAAGAPWYVRNGLETGNPLYPSRVEFRGATLFEGNRSFTSLQDRLGEKVIPFAESLPLPLLAPFSGKARELLLPAACAVENHNLGYGPGLLLLIPFFPLGVACLARERRYFALALGLLTLLLGLALFYAPGMRVIRTFWMFPSLRFLYIPVCVISLFTLAWLNRRMGEKALVMLCGAGIALNLYNALPRGFVEADLRIAVGVLLAGLAVFLLHRLRLLPRGRTGTLATVILVVISLTALWGIRGTSRTGYALAGWDLHNFPRYAAVGLNLTDVPDRGQRIAFSSGWDRGAGHTWLWYLLLGSRLQNSVTYVPVTRSGAVVDYEVLTADRVDFGAWHRRLRAARIDWVVTHPPRTVEYEWVLSHPECFETWLVDDGGGFSLSKPRGGKE